MEILIGLKRFFWILVYEITDEEWKKIKRDTIEMSILVILMFLLLFLTGCGTPSTSSISTNAGDTNHTPVITSLIADPAAVLIGKTSTITCSASDEDNDPLTYTWSADSGTISGEGSTITWTASTIVGDYAITCKVSDTKDETTSQVSVKADITESLPSQNHAPVITSLTADPSLFLAGETTQITCLATDVDNDTLAYTWTWAWVENNVNENEHAISSKDSSISWVSLGNKGTFAIICRVSDGKVEISSQVNVTTVYAMPDIELPSTPVDFIATVKSSSEIQLDWDPSTDNYRVDGYRVYDGAGQRIADITIYEYLVTGLSIDTQYCFSVSAVDSSGNESPQTSQVCKTTTKFMAVNNKLQNGDVVYLVGANFSNNLRVEKRDSQNNLVWEYEDIDMNCKAELTISFKYSKHSRESCWADNNNVDIFIGGYKKVEEYLHFGDWIWSTALSIAKISDSGNAATVEWKKISDVDLEDSKGGEHVYDVKTANGAVYVLTEYLGDSAANHLPDIEKYLEDGTFVYRFSSIDSEDMGLGSQKFLIKQNYIYLAGVGGAGPGDARWRIASINEQDNNPVVVWNINSDPDGIIPVVSSSEIIFPEPMSSPEIIFSENGDLLISGCYEANSLLKYRIETRNPIDGALIDVVETETDSCINAI